MTKYIIILFIALLPRFISAQTTYYVSTTGSDATGTGTTGNPWGSLSHACSQVTTSGDTIFIESGNYIENNMCNVAVGVNIKGDTTDWPYLTINYVADWNENDPDESAITLLSSTEGTNGNQSISNLILDGDNLTATTAILVRCRSNVKIHDIIIKDFFINAVCYIGSNVNPYTKPTAYSQNNQLYNVTIDNCTDTAETFNGGGLINQSGQENLTIHDFNFSDTSRGPGANGDIIVGGWYGKGLTIHNGNSYKPSTGNDGWNFHFEIPSEIGGTEIYNVNFYGGDQVLDIGDNIGDGNIAAHHDYSYPLKYHVHDCYFEDNGGVNGQGSHGKTAISIEGRNAKNILINNNTFKNIVVLFGITDGDAGACIDSNIVFRNNVSINTGTQNASVYESLITLNKQTTGSIMQDVYIINNSVVPNSLSHTTAIGITNSKTMNNIVIANNIFTDGKNGSWLISNNTGGTFDSLIIRNNILYNNPTTTPSFTGNSITNYINAGNINADPLYTSSTDLTPQSGSPAIGAAYPYGYGDDIGAIQSVVADPPTVSTSGNQTITVSTASITSTATAASGQSITSYVWTKISGSGSITSPTSQNTGLTGLSGTSIFRITVTQTDGQTAYAELTITVTTVAPPTVTTSGNQTLITNSTTVFSTPVAASGQTISSVLWTDITGSGSATITSPTSQNTGITGLSVGTHTFRVTVTQSDGQTAHADVSITLTAPPTANAGTDQTITLPTSSVTLSGSGTVASGQTASYEWTKVSGAGTQTITGNTTLTPVISGMTTAGDYVFQLKVIQTDTQFALSTVTVHVNAAPTPTQRPFINLRKPTIVIQIH